MLEIAFQNCIVTCALTDRYYAVQRAPEVLHDALLDVVVPLR